ncbi:MAG: two-component sensor histidine kinase [Desulfobacterales bacterium]|nr:MAG: two-component sensor histidine kinase [Desulfobacterales bacterium]
MPFIHRSPTKPENDLLHKLQWLMFSRVIFTSLLLGSTIIFQLGEDPSPLVSPLLVLYGLITAMFLLSFIYALILKHIKRELLFAYIQIGIDTFVVTLIIFVTGSFASIFSFLYLVVIIYSSMLLFRRGSMIMASLCSIQYGIMIDLEYYGILQPFVMEESIVAANHSWSYVSFKILITMVACFAVAFLSGFLSEQVRKTRRELSTMEERVKRVEKMAYMGEMAAGMAHEIKNPLASLAGSIQILKKEIQFDPELDKLMQIVLRETDRLSSLANNFLFFAKPPVGKIEIIRLDRTLIETIKLFEKDQTCRERIQIQNHLDPNIWIEMDPVHLRQVLWNLLLNAAEAIEGEGLIEIRTYSLKHNYVRIDITDNGCGMPRDVLKSIFDPFFTTKPDGTGLGLSIVHSILESYSYWLDVESQKAKGTTFTMKLKQVNPPA